MIKGHVDHREAAKQQGGPPEENVKPLVPMPPPCTAGMRCPVGFKEKLAQQLVAPIFHTAADTDNVDSFAAHVQRHQKSIEHHKERMKRAKAYRRAKIVNQHR